MTWERWFDGERERRERTHLERSLRALRVVDGLHVELDGRRITLFSTNDYLGLSDHPEVREAAAEAARGGLGPRGSPLVCGYTAEHQALERELAEFMGTESALLFPTGYAANLGVITALTGPGAEVFSDELNHASLIDGCRLARVPVHVFAHADGADLERRLASSSAARKLVVSDGVFSMDGDRAPVGALVEAASAHQALCVVDEAHALLVLGERGAGVSEGLDVAVKVGTLGKALGAQGGFVATSARIRDHLLNRGRPYIYSTAPTLPVVAAARAALRVFAPRRARLDGHRERLGCESAIHPVVLGSEERALAAAEALLQAGCWAPAMRPPTVPPDTCRLRITLSAGHTDDEIDTLLKAVGEVL